MADDRSDKTPAKGRQPTAPSARAEIDAFLAQVRTLGPPTFMFQEGYDPVAEKAFREIARLTRGAYSRFDPGAAHQLGELLRAAAAYAAGGMRALSDLSARRDPGAIKLIQQMR